MAIQLYTATYFMAWKSGDTEGHEITDFERTFPIKPKEAFELMFDPLSETDDNLIVTQFNKVE